MASFLKKVGDVVYFNGDGELVYFVPEKYFDTKNAIINGEYVNTLGMFQYGVFSKDGKMLSINLFNVPCKITCKPTSITKEADYHLKGTNKPDNYRLLHFSKDAEVMCSSKIPKALDNVESFMNLFIAGNMAQGLEYNKLHEYILANSSINGYGYGLSAQMIGIFVSELCRDPNNKRNAFRLSDMKDMKNYIQVNIKEIPRYISAYTSITSERADEAIANAMINGGAEGSPMEKVMMS